MANLGIIWISVTRQEVLSSKDHPRSTESALQAMIIPEALLESVQALSNCEPLNCRDFSAVGLYGKLSARFHSLAVYQDCTCAADTCFATNVSPG
jgi:hypothetical protein|tara:strand:- start:865 stop:1149 length:285 start_codon:yes stop_codon:yes gene_type:complete